MTGGRCARTIAIDGPSASGKSAVGSRVGRRLGYPFLDTGTMYRAVTYLALVRGIDVEDAGALGDLAERCRMEVAPGRAAEFATIVVDGGDVTPHLRDPDVTANVSVVSLAPRVREAMVRLQREIAADRPVVMAGRDIGTVVLPGADLKVYLEATPEVRGERRWLEMRGKGDPKPLAWHIEDLRRRDTIDSTRAISPLRPAEDAVIIDTAPLGLEEVVARVLALAGCPVACAGGSVAGDEG